MKLASVMLMSAVLSSTVSASYRSSVDANGCWDAKDIYGDMCLTQIDHTWDDGKISVKYRNNCNHRIYARLCNERKNGSWDCGSQSIRANSTTVYYTYNASGTVNGKAVGLLFPARTGSALTDILDGVARLNATS